MLEYAAFIGNYFLFIFDETLIWIAKMWINTDYVDHFQTNNKILKQQLKNIAALRHLSSTMSGNFNMHLYVHMKCFSCLFFILIDTPYICTKFLINHVCQCKVDVVIPKVHYVEWIYDCLENVLYLRQELLKFRWFQHSRWCLSGQLAADSQSWMFLVVSRVVSFVNESISTNESF